MSIEYEGDFDFAGLENRLNEIIPEALMDGGEFIGDRADLRAPVLVDLKRANKKRRANPGELRDSRFVRVEGRDVAVGYSAYWAGFQHEDLDYNHEIGEAKWLERTFTADGEEALGKVAARIKEAL